jgi:sterol 3beta-glucosyltransferase
MKGKKVLVASHGSRGDTQPFVALARGLKAAGFEVMVFTNPEQKDLVEDLGVQFAPNGNDFKTFFVSEASVKAFQANNFLNFLDALGKHNGACSAAQVELEWKCIQDFKPDLMVLGTQHWIDAGWIPILFNVPCIPVNLSNSHTVNPYKAPFALPTLPCGLNRPLWSLVFNAWVDGLKKGYGSLLEKLSGKPLAEFFPTSEDVMQIMGSGPKYAHAPYVIAQDDNLSGKQAVDPPHLVYTGSYYLPPELCKGEDFGGQKNSAQDAFLKACGEDRPVYIGWGSLKGAEADILSRFAARALKASGSKGIILGGWAGVKEDLIKGAEDEVELMEYSKKNILWMTTAAHEVLFPQCSVVIHHGGIGTTQVGLRSGRPNIITPIFYDQFDSADMVTSRQVGFATKQLLKIKPEEVAELIQKCKTDKELQKRAMDLAELINSRNGIKEFTNLAVKFMREEVNTGKYMAAVEQIAAEKKANAQKGSSSLPKLVIALVVLGAALYFGGATTFVHGLMKPLIQ